MKYFFLSSLLLFTLSFSLVHAQDAGQVDPVPKAQVVMQNVTNAANAANSKLPDSLPVTATVILGLLSEAVMHIMPTAKPKSYFLVISALLAALGGLLMKLSGLSTQVGNSFQNVTPPPK